MILLIFRVGNCRGRNMSQSAAEMGTMVNGSNPNCCSSSSKVVINDPNLLQQKKAAIRLAGPSKFQVFISLNCFL